MGQASSQAVADQSPTLAKTSKFLPTPSPTPLSTDSSLPAQSQSGTATSQTSDAPSLNSAQSKSKTEKSKRIEPSEHRRRSVKTELASTTPKMMQRVTKSEAKPAKKLRQSKLQESVRNGVNQISKNDFLSALNGAIKPEELARPRPTTPDPALQLTPSRNAKQAENVLSSPCSLIDYEKTRKRRVSGGHDGHATSVESPKQKKRKSSAKKPVSQVSNTNSGHAQSSSTPPVISRPIPTVDSKAKATSSASAGRLAAATSLEAFLIPIPTRTQPSSLRIPAQKANDNYDDAKRRQEVAHNYPKGIGKVTRKRTERSMEEIKSSGGPFIQEEVDRSHSFRNEFCQEHDLTIAEFNNLAHSESRAGGLTQKAWTAFRELYPYRGAISLRKIFRRQFDPYEHRVGWTKEEDEELREATEMFDQKWQKIGPAIGRHPEACRDRWRNYLRYKTMKMERWSADEVIALRMAVGTLMLKVWRDRYEEAPSGTNRWDVTLSDDECRKLVRWHAVSKLVPDRSRLQCSQKWMSMEQAGQADFQTEIDRARQREAGESDTKTQYYNEQPVSLLVGDQLRLCRAIKKLQADTEADSEWRQIRKSNPKLKIFQVERLRERWQQLRVEYLTEEEIADEDMEWSKAAKKVNKRLKAATPKEKRKESWAKYSKAERPKLPPLEPSKVPKSKYKSLELIQESDASEED